MINKIRYTIATITNSFSHMAAFNDFFLDYYLRHHKIIGWFKGKPVYSAFLTPGLSKPLANTLSRRLMSNLLQKPLPGMINIGVTDICNAKCEHCSFYKAMDNPSDRVLKTEQMKLVLKSCQNFGVSIINFVGGEPLLRKDIGELIASVDKDKSSSCLYTNGWHLKDKCQELKDAGLMMTIVSLDGTTAKRHDAFRRLPKLFDRAVAGIKECQKKGMLTAISTTVTQDDIEDGSFEKMIQFSKELKVNELIVFDTMPVGMYSHREDLKKRGVDKDKLFEIIDKYNADKTYPGIFCYAHFRDPAVFGCSAGRNYFYVSPYGDMHPCNFTARPLGNLTKEAVADVWFRLVDMKAKTCGTYMNSCCKTKTSRIKIIDTKVELSDTPLKK